MAYIRPTVQTIISRSIADIESRIVGGDATLKNTTLNILALLLSGVAHGLYGHQAWIARQILPDTADTEILDRHASWRNVTRNAAAKAVGAATFLGVDTTVVPTGTIIQRSDGEQYITDADGTIVGGTIDINITALVGGELGNASVGQSLQLVTPIIDIQPNATVATGGLVGGTDIETDDRLRDRLRQRAQKQPQGGSIADYETWAKEVAGVTRVKVIPQWSGAGTVGVAFVRDDDVTLIPDAGEVQAVQDYIDPLRPVTATVIAFAPTEVVLPITIKLSPNTSAVQAAVQAELEDLFANEANIEDGSGSGTLYLSRLNESISRAVGEFDHEIVTPVANVTLTSGQITTLGVITWQAL